MITRLQIENFKSFKNFSTRLAPLTVLSGLNGSGKSSFIQALLLLKSNALNSEMDFQLPLSREGLYDFGLQSDAFYCYSQTLGAQASISATDENGNSAGIAFTFDNPDSKSFKTRSLLGEGGAAGLPAYLQAMQYVSAGRMEPTTKHPYDVVKALDRCWEKDGRNALAFYLEHRDKEVPLPQLRIGESKAGKKLDTTFLTQVNAWLSDLIAPGTQIFADRKPAEETVDLRIGFTTRREGKSFQPKNVGYGISIVLPLVIALLAAKSGDCLIFENPEAHLHPSGQAKFGRMLALAAAAGVQVIVETHSDHVINGMRVAVKDKTLSLKDLSLKYFVREDHGEEDGIVSQHTEEKPVTLDETGNIVDYPEGFLDEWANQLCNLWA